MLCLLVTNFTRWHFEISFVVFFLQKTVHVFDILSNLSPSYQTLLSDICWLLNLPVEWWKAPYSSKIDIFIQERFNKLLYAINTIIKCGIWQPVKFQLVSRFWTGTLPTLIQGYDKNPFFFFFDPFQEWETTEILQAVRCHILRLY